MSSSLDNGANAGTGADGLEPERRLSSERLAAPQADRALFAQIAARARAFAVKQSVIEQMFAAAALVRTRAGQIPSGLYFEGATLRSSLPRRSAPPRLGRSDRRRIEASGLFDAAFYLARNPDVAASGVDPFGHFLRHGIGEERDPHPLFNSGWYRNVCPSVGHAPPFLHFLAEGRRRGLSPHPLFDARYYLEANKLAALDGLDPFTHFITEGGRRRLAPHPLVWIDRLTAHDALRRSANPLAAYVADPGSILASPHPLFEPQFYLAENPDVARLGCNPLLHYCVIGWRQGRRPHRLFAGDWYLAQNADVLRADIDPLEHYVRAGAREERSPHPLFDVRFFLENQRFVRKAACDPLSYYVQADDPDQFETTAKITVAEMRGCTPRAHGSKIAPISAFMAFGQSDILTPLLSAAIGDGDALSQSWPPNPDGDYWLAQKLRDFLIYRCGESVLPLYTFLMSVVNRYGDQPDAFGGSAAFAALCSRLEHHALGRGAPDEPDVSIIIPVYNNLVFTLTAVVSILENAAQYTYEIIIGDDVSSDQTEALFKAIGGPIVLVRQPRNLGFLGNCNAAAARARGRYLVFLNNDTLTLPGWLDELILPFADRTVGLTGSKLLNADGTLQEGGGIYWRDGSAWNFGRNADADAPAFNYAKDADYISGASIALPGALWRELQGFDPVFSPAYCEDSDLAFRVRAAGLRTRYAPFSEVVHHEGKSHGRDLDRGVKKFQALNQAKLLQRWRATLERDHFPNGQDVFLARDRSRWKPHVLVVDHYIPKWNRDAGSRAIYHLLRMLQDADVQVTFWPDNLHEDTDYCRQLQKLGVEVVYGGAFIDGFDGFMQANGRYFQYAILSRPHIAINYYDSLRAWSDAKILYYGHDIHFRRMELEAKSRARAGDAAAIADMRALELDNWRRADAVLYFSKAECDDAARILTAAKALRVPLFGYTAQELATARANVELFDQRACDTLMFVGGDHPPNVDALLWFTRDVLPLILRERPQTRLHIVGSAQNQDLSELESEAIVLHGRISDDELAQMYRTVGAAIIPLRFGGGVKGKTIEALVHAAPFITTSIGMQGLEPGEPIAFIADDAVAFAAAVARSQTARDETRANVLRGMAFVEQNYSSAALRRDFGRVIPELQPADARVR